MKTVRSRTLALVTPLLALGALVFPLREVSAENQFTVKPFLMLGQIDGDLRAEGVDADFGLGWGNSLQKGNGAIGLDFDARQDELSLLSQIWYTALSDTKSNIEGFPGSFTQVDVSGTFWTETFGVSVFMDDKTFFDLTIGGRLASVSNSFSARTDATGQSDFSQSKTWVDPVVGFKAHIPADDRISFDFGGDYGGFNVSSKVTWQGVIAANYSLTKRTDVSLSYRAMMYDYDEGNFRYDLLMHGPSLGLVLHF
jgi:hypothetical protein